MEIYIDNLINNLHTCTGKIKKFVLTVKTRVATNVKKQTLNVNNCAYVNAVAVWCSTELSNLKYF